MSKRTKLDDLVDVVTAFLNERDAPDEVRKWVLEHTDKEHHAPPVIGLIVEIAHAIMMDPNRQMIWRMEAELTECMPWSDKPEHIVSGILEAAYDGLTERDELEPSP